MPEYRATSRAQAAAAAATLSKGGAQACLAQVMSQEEFRRSVYSKPKRPEYATQYYKPGADHAEIVLFHIFFRGDLEVARLLLREAWSDLGWADNGLELKPSPHTTHSVAFVLPLVRGRVRKKTVDPLTPGKRQIRIDLPDVP